MARADVERATLLRRRRSVASWALLCGLVVLLGSMPGGVLGQEGSPTTIPDWGLPDPTPPPTQPPPPATTVAPSPTPGPPRTTVPIVTTTTIDDGPSSIVVATSAEPKSVLQVGGRVRFEVVVENTSEFDVVTIESVLDDVFGDISPFCFPELPADIPPGETVVCAFREQVSGAQAPELRNTVFVDGTDDDGDPVAGSASAVVSVAAAVDVELTVVADRNNVSVGEVVAWDVVVANRGPSAATGVRVRVTLPGDTTFVSSSCVAYDSGLHRSSCEFNPNLGVSELEPIPPGTAVALLILTKADAVGSTELRAEVVGLEQPDLDSSPLDRTGDDIDADEILVTVDAVEGSTGDGGSGAVPGGSLPIWPVALLAAVAVAAIALAWRPTFWRLR